MVGKITGPKRLTRCSSISESKLIAAIQAPIECVEFKAIPETNFPDFKLEREVSSLSSMMFYNKILGYVNLKEQSEIVAKIEKRKSIKSDSEKKIRRLERLEGETQKKNRVLSVQDEWLKQQALLGNIDGVGTGDSFDADAFEKALKELEKQEL